MARTRKPGRKEEPRAVVLPMQSREEARSSRRKIRLNLPKRRGSLEVSVTPSEPRWQALGEAHKISKGRVAALETETYLVRLKVCRRHVAGLLPPEMSRHRHPRVRVKARAKASQWQARRERAVRDD